MVGTWFQAARGCSAASQETKLGILGILLAVTCAGGRQGACPLVIPLLGTSYAGCLLAQRFRSPGRREQVAEQRWEEEMVLFLPLSAGGTLWHRKNNPDCSANKTTQTKQTTKQRQQKTSQKITTQKTLHSFSWKDTVCYISICPGGHLQLAQSPCFFRYCKTISCFTSDYLHWVFLHLGFEDVFISGKGVSTRVSFLRATGDPDHSCRPGEVRDLRELRSCHGREAAEQVPNLVRDPKVHAEGRLRGRGNLRPCFISCKIQLQNIYFLIKRTQIKNCFVYK